MPRGVETEASVERGMGTRGGAGYNDLWRVVIYTRDHRNEKTGMIG